MQGSFVKCDMCGSDFEELFKTNIEGAEMSVCKPCSSYGKVISRLLMKVPEKPIAKKEAPARNEIIILVKSDYSNVLKSAREKLGLKQDELAKLLAEKASTIHNLETGHIKPNIDLARKLEKFLNVKLLEEYEESGSSRKVKSGSMTIGDVFKN